MGAIKHLILDSWWMLAIMYKQSEVNGVIKQSKTRLLQSDSNRLEGRPILWMGYDRSIIQNQIPI